MDKEPVFEQTFSNDPSRIHEGFQILRDENGWFHALPSGKPAYSDRYTVVEPFENGIAWVRSKDGKCKRIYTNGTEAQMEHTSSPVG